MSALLDYKNYLFNHIQNVKEAFETLISKANGKIFYLTEREIERLRMQINRHDIDKFEENAFIAYANYLYGEQNEQSIKSFKKSYTYHHYNIPHHYEYYYDENGKPNEMPLNCVIEMLSDWWSFSIKKNNLQEIQNFYNDKKDCIILHENTKTLVERILIFISNEFQDNNILLNNKNNPSYFCNN